MNESIERIELNCNSLINCGVTTGLALTVGNEKVANTINKGYCEDDKLHLVKPHTVFDLASLTKLFLSLSYFIAQKYQKINFSQPLSFFCADKFPKIKNITLDDLFHFNCFLTTEKRITECNFEKAKKQVLNIDANPFDAPKYSDMSSIVLGIVFSDIFGIEFGNFVNSEIIKRLKLKNTFWGKRSVDESNSYMNYDSEMVINNGILTVYPQKPLVVNDRKAEILSDNGKYLCGNAGLFSTAEDMEKICLSILSRELISDDALKTIGTKANCAFEQRFGYLSYTKSPNKHLSEVSHLMSDLAFAISGFTGTYLMIDPVKNCYLFIGGNRLNNRITFVDDEKLIVSPTRVMFEGKEYYYTKNYVYMKDELRNRCCKYLLDQSN